MRVEGQRVRARRRRSRVAGAPVEAERVLVRAAGRVVSERLGRQDLARSLSEVGQADDHGEVDPLLGLVALDVDVLALLRPLDLLDRRGVNAADESRRLERAALERALDRARRVQRVEDLGERAQKGRGVSARRETGKRRPAATNIGRVPPCSFQQRRRASGVRLEELQVKRREIEELGQRRCLARNSEAGPSVPLELVRARRMDEEARHTSVRSQTSPFMTTQRSPSLLWASTSLMAINSRRLIGRFDDAPDAASSSRTACRCESR